MAASRRLHLGFLALLAMVFVQLLLVPVLSEIAGGLRLERFLGLLVLTAALGVTGRRRLGVTLFVAAIVLQLVTALEGHHVVLAASAVGRFAFLGYVLATIVRYVIGDRRITADTLGGAACAYVVLALAWAEVFLFLEYLHPGSFTIPASWRPGVRADPTTALTYFSLSTLTTVSYGVVLPAGLPAGALSVCEALMGQLYLAIMIARLVGLHTSQRGS